MAGVFVGGDRTRQERTAKSMAEPFLPKWIAWETTQRCNLRCVHCRCSSELTSAQGDFTTAEAFALLDQIAELSKPVVVLSGGEPLLPRLRHRPARHLRLAVHGDQRHAHRRRLREHEVGACAWCRSRSTARRLRSDDFARCGAFDGTLRNLLPPKHGITFLINSRSAQPGRHRQ
jgi:hypothetical protein